MQDNINEVVEKFREEWQAASTLSPNLKWAIFPTGDQQIEVLAVENLLTMFPNIDSIVYVKNNEDPAEVIKVLEATLAKYKENQKARLTTAAEEHGYSLHTGV